MRSSQLSEQNLTSRDLNRLKGHDFIAISAACADLRAAIFSFLRCLNSVGPQLWQCRHSRPLRQPCGFTKNEHGLHLPVACSSDPIEGSSSGIATGSLLELQSERLETDCEVLRPSDARPVSLVLSGPAVVSEQDSGSSLFSDSETRMESLSWCERIAVRFSFLRCREECSGHEWQCRQSLPFAQPAGFQNQPQGLQFPDPCRAAPTDGRSAGQGIPWHLQLATGSDFAPNADGALDGTL